MGYLNKRKSKEDIEFYNYKTIEKFSIKILRTKNITSLTQYLTISISQVVNSVKLLRCRMYSTYIYTINILE